MSQCECFDKLKVAALAGGVGGARLVDGLAQILKPKNLSAIVNTGDDFEYLGLFICPDLDTVCYTMAGLANPATGWGRSGESWKALETLGELGGPTWFRLGDRDLGLNLERTRRLCSGQTLSEITRHFCQTFGIEATIIPMSDDRTPTYVMTDEGRLAFQDYFVRRQCQPHVRGFEFVGIDKARPAPGVLTMLQQADLILLCPSNPWVSIDPILAVPGIREIIERATTVAVSPIIGGRTIKGPAAKMFEELGIEPSATAVAQHYKDLLKGFVLDTRDAKLIGSIQSDIEAVIATDTIMRSRNDRRDLAIDVMQLGIRLLHKD